MKISFILPVYNVEAYLRECVESLLAQTYTVFEIVLVDDGSPDGSPALCDQLATEDNRIKVLHKPNGGLSDARNAGLNIASGDYVIFVDSDDKWIGENSLEKLIELIKTYPECQFYGFNCQYFYPATNTYSKWVAYAENILTPINGSSAMCALVESGTFPMSACLKIFKKSFLLNNKLYFEKGILAEDIPWFISVLEKCGKCVFSNQYIYAYRQNVIGSITQSFGERSFNNLFMIIKRELSWIENRQFDYEAKQALYSFLAYEYCILLASIRRLDNSLRCLKRKELLEYKWLLKYDTHPKVKKVAFLYKIIGIKWIEIILNKYLMYARK